MIGSPGTFSFTPHPSAVQNGWNSSRVPLIALAFSEKCPFSQKQVYHRNTENTERENYFFVYREMPATRRAGLPIDENNLSNQVGDGRIYHRPIPEDLGPVRVFVHHSSTCRGFEAEFFVCRYLPTNKNSSLCPRRLCGENPNLDRHDPTPDVKKPECPTRKGESNSSKSYPSL